MGCTKVVYQTQQAATVAAELYSVRFPETPNVPYHCHSCNKWHITTGLTRDEKVSIGVDTPYSLRQKKREKQQEYETETERQYWLGKLMPKRGPKKKKLKKIRHNN